MKLYTIDFCPYCNKVRKKLEALGVEYEEKKAPKPHEERDEVHELSGQRKVPVLVDGDEVVHDSGEILRYLDENYG